MRVFSWRMLPFSLCAFVAAMLMGACSVEDDAADAVFFIVRHAEKQSATGDAPLSSAGAERAKQLMQTLEHLRVEAIYHTDFARTRETAKPLADKLGVTPVTYAEPSARWLKEVLLKNQGKRALLVGHSNTVHLMVKGLSGQSVPEVADSQYDNLFVVVVSGDKKSVVQLKYGAATP